MLAVAWFFYLTITVYLKVFQPRYLFYFLAVISLLVGYTIQYKGLEYNPYILYFACLFFASINKDRKVEIPTAFVFYIFILFIYLYHYHSSIWQEILTAASILPLFYLTVFQFKDKERFYSTIYLICLILTNFFSNIAFEILNILAPVYMTVDAIQKVLNKRDKEIERFKINLKKNIETEIQREMERLEVKLQIAYKKLKEIFKLNSYTMKEISIDEIAARVVKGLADLGYTGAVLEIRKSSVLKKEGFFPNFRNYAEEVFNSVENVTEAEENKILIIPLDAEGERLGTLAVYSKNEIGNEEIDYLITYAKSIATSIAKIDYFTQLIKLRDLIYTAVDSINIPMVVTNTDLNIEITNTAFIKLINNDNITHQNIMELFPVLKKLSQHIKDVAENRTSMHQTINLLEGTTEKFFEIRVYPVISEEKVESLVFIIEDITEKIQMEKQILHSEKLAVIGRLTAGISHEIKNPLAIISQAAFSLKRKIVKNCEKEQIPNMNELIERIEKSTDRAKDIIDRLLNFSKPYYNKSEKINIRDVLKEAVKLAILQTERDDIKIHSYIEDAYVSGDKNSLIQVFINMIINSIEAIPSTGKITIKARPNKEKGTVKITIKDTGHGIPSEIIDKIFEPFFTTKEKGTGLGLAVSYKIVRDHGGEIFVKSEEGHGAEFTIILPMAED